MTDTFSPNWWFRCWRAFRCGEVISSCVGREGLPGNQPYSLRVLHSTQQRWLWSAWELFPQKCCPVLITFVLCHPCYLNHLSVSVLAWSTKFSPLISVLHGLCLLSFYPFKDSSSLIRIFNFHLTDCPPSPHLSFMHRECVAGPTWRSAGERPHCLIFVPGPPPRPLVFMYLWVKYTSDIRTTTKTVPRTLFTCLLTYLMLEAQIIAHLSSGRQVWLLSMIYRYGNRDSEKWNTDRTETQVSSKF